MKLHPQATPELTRIGELIKDMPVAMMVTLDDDLMLVSRPMTALEMDAEGSLWFFTDLRSTKLTRLKTVNLSFADSGSSSYLSLSGQGHTDTDAARIQALWTPLAKPWFPDGPASPNLALLKFVPSAAESWGASASRMVRFLALVASIVSGKPLAMGDHDIYPDLFSGTDVPTRTDRSPSAPHTQGAFQFDLSELTLQPRLRPVLAELVDVMDGWTLASWFAHPGEALAGRSALSMWRDHGPVVVQAARQQRCAMKG
jgi:general stress protein 26